MQCMHKRSAIQQTEQLHGSVLFGQKPVLPRVKMKFQRTFPSSLFISLEIFLLKSCLDQCYTSWSFKRNGDVKIYRN